MNSQTEIVKDEIGLNNWIFSIVNPYLKGRTLEIGSGSGFMHNIFIKENLPIHLSDADLIVYNDLRASFRGIFQAIHGVHHLDIGRLDFGQTYSMMREAFGTVLSLSPGRENYLSQKSIQNAKYILRARGHLMLLIPVNTALFPGSEPDWDDFKHICRPFIIQFMSNDFTVLKIRCFNPDNFTSFDSVAPIYPTALVVARKN